MWPGLNVLDQTTTFEQAKSIINDWFADLSLLVTLGHINLNPNNKIIIINNQLKWTMLSLKLLKVSSISRYYLKYVFLPSLCPSLVCEVV